MVYMDGLHDDVLDVGEETATSGLGDEEIVCGNGVGWRTGRMRGKRRTRMLGSKYHAATVTSYVRRTYTQDVSKAYRNVISHSFAPLLSAAKTIL